MKRMINKYVHLILLLSIVMMGGCTKDFLDAKPSNNLILPTTLDELQKLLDNTVVMNPSIPLGIFSADEYEYTNSETWQSGWVVGRKAYIWEKDLYEGTNVEYWSSPYSAIFYANNVLATLNKIDVTQVNQADWNNIKGSALFSRAFFQYALVSNFAKAYNTSSAAADLGIPLRTNPSIDEIMPRASVQESYDRILQDLTSAAGLLKFNIASARTRPSKSAAHALFARIYLSMRNYEKAEAHADTSLQLYNKLIDYNTLSKTATSPFANNHDEQLFVSTSLGGAGFSASANNAVIKMSPGLINLYSPNDLRLVIFFIKQSDGTYDMKRNYVSSIQPFLGLATDEVYLVKAECAARRDDVFAAMSYLNQLLIKRWNPNATVPSIPFVNLTATDRQDALDKVLLERRKELIWRGLRWQDLKRLNLEGANIILTRTINGNTYTLPPNDPRYVFPIPDNEIMFSNIPQNQR